MSGLEFSIVHPPLRHYRWHLLKTAVERQRDGSWWVRCGYAPLQRTPFNPFDLVGLVGRVLLSFIWCQHVWERISSEASKGRLCCWCGRKAPLETVNIHSLRRCERCQQLKLRVREWSWDTGPGHGRFADFCDECWEHRPKGWYEVMGISRMVSPGVTFMRYVGEPRVTASENGQNAYGSVLSEYSDGARIGVMCGHGGSAWLCLTCAQKLVAKSP